MDFVNDFKATQENISQAIVNTVRSASQLSAEDTPFYRSLDPTLGQALDQQNARLLSLTQRLLSKTSANPQVGSLRLSDAEAVESKWKSLVDVTDTLLERADTCLDEYTGLIKRASPQSAPSSPGPSSRPTQRSSKSFRTQKIPKPQLHFEVKPSNNEHQPFKPFISAKPNATVPFESSFEISPNDFGNPQYQHPYAAEIEQYTFPSFVNTQSEPQPYTDMDSKNIEFVDTLEGVYRMLDELKKAPIVAIDLEHHDIHSYVGIVSLMQISTRNHDWIVDTLKPWRRKLEILNEVFTNPNILKVLHGAHMDIIWLQRDLGLYIVGLFDTHHASRVLGYAGGSLAFLLKKFIDFDAQKQYQTADWRLRPLPTEMFDYARSDTHFLLYIFDNMRNELIETSKPNDPEQDKLFEVLQRSKETALLRYEHPVYDGNRGVGRGGWFSLLQRTPALLSKQEFGVFRKLHQWRDQVARQEDENPIQIMPNHTLFNLAKSIPRDLTSLLNCLHPISQPVQLRSSDLLAIIQKANAESVNGPEMGDVLNQISEELGLHTKSRALPHKTTTNSSVQQGLTSLGPAEATRIDSSQFWGSTLSNPASDVIASSTFPPVFAITPSIPACDVEAFTGISTLDSGITQTSAQPRSSDIPDRSSSARTTDPADSVLRKRKQDDLDVENDTPTHSQPSTPAEEDSASHPEERDIKFLKKLQQRAERKPAKKQAMDSTVLNSAGGDDLANGSTDADAQPFDYTTTPSILNADKTDQRGKRSKKYRAPFNPYAKASEARSGLGKSRPKAPGKSGTFH